MKSPGYGKRQLGMADSFGLAFYKSQEAAGGALPLQGTALITIADRDKNDIVAPARRFRDLGFRILASQGTMRFLAQNGIDSNLIWKIHEGRPNIVDAIKSGEIHLIINTPHGKVSEVDDSYIRKNAVKYKIPYITTAAAALAAAIGIDARRQKDYPVKSLQEYHADLQREKPGQCHDHGREASFP